MPADNLTLYHLNVGKENVVFILFPEKISNFQEVCKKINLLAKSINKNNSQTLVVGLSAWGAELEKRYLEFPGCSVHVLLGSGKGSGMKGKFANKGRTIWVRPYSKGKAVNLLKVLKFPFAKKVWQWKQGENVILDVIPLTDRIPSDKKILKILKGVTE